MAPRLDELPSYSDRCRNPYHVDWDGLEAHIAHQSDRGDGLAGLDLEPDFQRGHVWTAGQQSQYIEYCLTGGRSGRELLFNFAGYDKTWRGPYVIVDGKQRLRAVRGFMAGEVVAFGRRLQDFEGRLPVSRAYLLWTINDLPTRKLVLEWYLALNAGGTPHTPEELDQVRALLAAEER